MMKLIAMYSTINLLNNNSISFAYIYLLSVCAGITKQLVQRDERNQSQIFFKRMTKYVRHEIYKFLDGEYCRVEIRCVQK